MDDAQLDDIYALSLPCLAASSEKMDDAQLHDIYDNPLLMATITAQQRAATSTPTLSQPARTERATPQANSWALIDE